MFNDTMNAASPVASVKPAPSSVTARSSVLVPGLWSVAAAAVATTVIAAIASGAGVSFATGSGSEIPTSGFTTLTVLFSLLGVGLATALQRRASRPRRTFLRATLALLVLSFVPDLASGFTADATFILILAHVAAAAIVIPALAARLAPTR